MFNFWVSIGLDPGYKCTTGIFDRSKFKVTRDISLTISGWLPVYFLTDCVAITVYAIGRVRLSIRLSVCLFISTLTFEPTDL